MMDVKNAAVRLKSTLEAFGRKDKFGSLDDKALGLIKLSLPISPEMIAWYEAAAPVDVEVPWTGNPLTLYNPTQLVKCQGGYRWQLNHPENLFPEWDKNWIVIGGLGHAAVIAHTDAPDTMISMALHGTITWNPQMVASSLAVFLEMLSIWVRGVGTYDRFELGEKLEDIWAGVAPALSEILDTEQIKTFRLFLE
ncbi:MAG: hypothetical protein DPW16_09375 [Chloroflexi bacterium]|nr:hypothetical protein [Chloroflexota bacterium]